MTDPRPARWLDNADGTHTLRISCQHVETVVENGVEYEVGCQHEQRYTLIRDQLTAYINGASLGDWADIYAADPWCDQHQP